MLKKITLTLSALACLALFNAAAQEEEKASETPLFDSAVQRTLIISGSGRHLDLNPHTSSYSNEAQIINALQEGLFCYDPKTLDPLPALASSYKLSRDKKRWTFTIREGAELSDGTPVTAQTVIDSWLKLQKTPYAPYASLLDCIAGIREYRENNASIEKVGLKANGQKLLVTLNSPTAYLPRLLCHHSFSVFTGKTEVFSGAYKISYQDDTVLTLIKNEKYWDKDKVALNEIQILFSENKKENTWLYNTGRTDWIMSSIDSDALISKNDIKLCNLFGTTYLFFTCRNPVWDNADFRNALLTAIPWDELRKDNLFKADSLVYPLTGYPKVNGLTETSEDEALEMMADARRKAGIASDKKLEITFGITESDYMKELAQLLKDAWAPLGVELVTYKIKDDQYFSNISYLNYDLFSYSWIGDYADPVAFLELFREGSTLNQTKWTNKDFTEKLSLSDSETDTAARYKLLSQAEQILLDDGIIIPISHNLSIHAINLKAIGGWYINALDIHPFKFLYFKQYEEEKLPNIVRK